MKIIKYLSIFLITVFLCSCGISNSSSDFLELVSKTERMELQEVKDLYESQKNTSSEDNKFYEKIRTVETCKDTYLQKSDSSNKTYKASFEYYVSKGDIYCHIEYLGYTGTLDDAPVVIEDNGEYIIKINPTGHLYSKTHDFTFLLSPNKGHVSWEGIEYDLSRSSGSVDEEDYETSFENSTLYGVLVEALDNAFLSHGMDYDMEFDSKTKELNIYVELGEDLKKVLISNYDALKDSWEALIESEKNLCNTINTSISIVGGKTTNMVFVDALKLNNKYDEEDMCLWIKNGEVKYEIKDRKNNTSTNSSNNTSSNNSNSSSNNSSSNNYSNNSSNSSSSSTSIGEKNALKAAQDYLSFSAFSKKGLKEQLEFEGFTSKEADYAVNNCGADWDYQAYRMAQEYLNFSSFSKQGLKEQLEFEGFTSSQANYGVNKAYN